MNPSDGAGSSMSEDYWQAILSQGERPSEAPAQEIPELWDGVSYALPDHHPDSSSEPRYSNDGYEARWARAKECLETGEILELEVVGYNRGGLLVEWDGLRGFVPASHLSHFTAYQADEQRLAELAQHVGTHVRAKVIELDVSEERFILSQRMTTDEAARRTELLARIKPTDACQGRVTNLCSFGAFVDLGGVEGLIHISELSWGRVDHPKDVLHVGQEVNVYVLNVAPVEGRVGLSLKRLLPDPWETVDKRYRPGQLVEGIVTNVVNFGAFARIEEGLEGLIHVSELAEGSFLHPRNVVREGEKITARVLSLDSRRRRMALSLRQVDAREASDGADRSDAEIWAGSSSPATVYRS
jgi:small subunit ribosomal protein S1